MKRIQAFINLSVIDILQSMNIKLEVGILMAKVMFSVRAAKIL
jgi:hypothetical protein